uniref:Uncharacterized protein n=1 Tax=Oryza brachyantha TaxID=4533 RepID=J3MS78_ORYBR
MACRVLEVTLVSAKDLKKAMVFSKMRGVHRDVYLRLGAHAPDARRPGGRPEPQVERIAPVPHPWPRLRQCACPHAARVAPCRRPVLRLWPHDVRARCSSGDKSQHGVGGGAGFGGMVGGMVLGDMLADAEMDGGTAS